ncbi:rhomboid-type serine protease 2 [Trichomonascus vanleenenianus]|uniref:putative rhomboid protease RBD2 n=1 Tax=Trichomonascus vanleenenianus TaxID=2268995 RepID=UPI003EC973CE
MVEGMALTPSVLSDLDLNKLSVYPLMHLGLLHLIFNMWALYPLVLRFELNNGTVRTGIVLNLLAVLPGVVYGILGFIGIARANVVGSSGWIFSFFGFFTLKEYRSGQKVWKITNNSALPTWSMPVIALVVIAIIIPGSSFLGHLLGLLAGWAMEMGYMRALIEPSTKVVEFIETKLARAIALIPSQFKYITEVQARDIRAQSGQELPTIEGSGRLLGTN